MNKATLATLSDPEFFESYYDETQGNVYVSGDNIAKDPSLYAYLWDKNRNCRNKGDCSTTETSTRVITIGSVDEYPNLDKANEYSLIDWAQYVWSKNHDIVGHSMNFMLNEISDASENHVEHHMINIARSTSWMEQIRSGENRIRASERAADYILEENSREIDQLLEQLIHERIGTKSNCWAKGCDQVAVDSSDQSCSADDQCRYKAGKFCINTSTTSVANW